MSMFSSVSSFVGKFSKITPQNGYKYKTLQTNDHQNFGIVDIWPESNIDDVSGYYSYFYQFPFLKHVEVCVRGELNNRFRKAGLCARKWPDCIFLHLLIQSFWVSCDLSSKISVKKTTLFEAEIYVPGYAQNAGFCTIYPRASGGIENTQ